MMNRDEDAITTRATITEIVAHRPAVVCFMIFHPLKL
jgi:hypothetical protein